MIEIGAINDGVRLDLAYVRRGPGGGSAIPQSIPPGPIPHVATHTIA
jgi:hypothetical protein